MKVNVKSIGFFVGALILLGGGFFLLRMQITEYTIISFTLAGVLLIAGVLSFINNSNPNRAYESKVKDILNTFDSILVKSSRVPELEGRNIILVESIDDLVDAQLEIRKPICYHRQSESCSFVLLDDKEAYVYVEKLNPEITSAVEIEINNLKVKSKNADEMDSEMLRDIEKTTIVKLSNQKSYKVSPVRKKKHVVEEEIEIL